MTIVQTNEKFISKLMLISFADLSSLISTEHWTQRNS